MDSLPHSASKVDNPASIKLGESFNFHNKEITAPLKLNKHTGEMSNAYAKAAFKTVESTLPQIASHVLTGNAISVAACRNNWRKEENFISSQIMGLDFDHNVSVEQLATDDIAGRYAFLIYATPTSTPETPKSRPLFILDAPITDPEQYRRLLKRLMHQYEQGEKADKSCKDPVRYFNGSANAEHCLRLDAVLPIAVLEALPPHPDELREVERARLRAERAANPTPRDSRYEHNYAIGAIESEAQELEKTGKGARHDQNMHAATVAGSFVWVVGEQYAYNRILDAALIAGRDRAKAEKDTQDGIDYGMKNPRDIPPPKPTASGKRSKRSVQARERKELETLLSLPSNASGAPTFTPFAPDSVTANRTANVQYLTRDHYTASDVAGYDLAMLSDMGTAKTTAAREALAKVERLLVVTYLQSLSEKLASDLDTECYKGLTASQLRQIPRLTSTIQSLWKVADQQYDVLFADEIEKVLNALRGGTLKGHEAVRAYSAFKQVAKTAGRVIFTDAHLTPIAVKFLEFLRGSENVLTCVNGYVRERAEMVMYPSAAAVMLKIEQLADLDEGVIVVPTNSEKEAKRQEAYFSQRYGEENVFAIYGEVSGEPERKTVINDPNRRIGNYRVFIYSPSLASGIDIQAPVRAVCAVFNAEPLGAGECHQMQNRCRNAQEYHTYVQRGDGQRETNAENLMRVGLENATLTADYAEFEGEAYTSDQAGLHRLTSMMEAQDNASKNHFYDHFLTMATGYKRITVAPVVNVEAMKAARAEATRQLEAIEKTRTLAATPIDDETFKTLSENGKITAEVRAGFRRWQIERAAGCEITPELYDLLKSSEARTALFILRDATHASESDLKARDKADQKSPIARRKHFARRIRILRHLTKSLFNGNMQATLELADLENVMSEFMGLFGEEVTRLFGRRADKSANPVALARWLLAKMHLKLESVQVMENRQRRRVYRLNAEQLTQWQTIAASSWQRYQDDQAQRQKKAITQNRDIRTTTPTENEKTLEQFDREYEQAINAIDDDSNRQALTQQYRDNRAALAANWKARGYAIPRESRIARQYAGV